MAAGKSRVGRTLAQRLNLSFVDTDAAIEESYGIPITQIFRERGEPIFREAERQLIARLLSEPQVIAIGGGAFLDQQTREAAIQQARTVWLDAPLDLILARLARSNARPLASDKSEQELRELWNKRRPFYAEAEIRIDTSSADPEQIVQLIIAELQQVRER
jgi:shikimate kinase